MPLILHIWLMLWFNLFFLLPSRFRCLTTHATSFQTVDYSLIISFGSIFGLLRLKQFHGSIFGKELEKKSCDRFIPKVLLFSNTILWSSPDFHLRLFHCTWSLFSISTRRMSIISVSGGLFVCLSTTVIVRINKII